MTAEQYRALSAPFRRHKRLKTALLCYNKLATASIASAYFIALAVLLFLKDPRFLRILCVPATAFILLTALRTVINRPRPYEILDIEPLFPKKKNGNSCPSRHTFSAFTVAVVLFYLYPAAGIITAVAGLFLAVARVIAGVHFPSDVILGAILGIGLTSLGLYIPLPFPA